MPTVAESREPERTERIAQSVKEFIEARPLTINDSEDVLRARLFSLGLRGTDLSLEVSRAKMKKFERNQIPKPPFCQKRPEEGRDGGQWWACHYCGSMWTETLNGVGWLPLSCPDKYKGTP